MRGRRWAIPLLIVVQCVLLFVTFRSVFPNTAGEDLHTWERWNAAAATLYTSHTTVLFPELNFYT